MSASRIQTTLGFGNFVLVGPHAYLQRCLLQSVIKAAARTCMSFFGFAVTTTSPTLFHRLRIFEQVEFKVAVMAFRVLYGLAPSYIDQLVYVANLPGHRRLCWSPSQMRQVPAHRFATVGRRSFPVAASILDWIVQCFTSPPTEYRLYGRRFLQVKRPNQQYQSTKKTRKNKHKRQSSNFNTGGYTN